MESSRVLLLSSLLLISLLMLSPTTTAAGLRQNYYANTCPNLEKLVRGAVAQRMSLSAIAAPATLRLFFHDCLIKGCDASVMIVVANNEFSHPDDSSLKVEGFNTVLKAKAAVDSDPQCTNKVSCADILALAARDAVFLQLEMSQSGGPSYPVELGRFDSKTSTSSSVVLPHPDFNLNQLSAIFSPFNFTQTDIIALSGAHTMGASSCSFFASRLYGPSQDPSMNQAYALQLRRRCPPGFSGPSAFAFLDSTTPFRFDNAYYQNLVRGMGLLGSDQALYNDPQSRPTVGVFAANQGAFFNAFTSAVTKLGRISPKTAANGEIRRDCRVAN